MGRMDGPQMCCVCRRHPVDPRWRPFCSRRCQTEDQARWATGTYRVPGPPAGSQDEHDDE
ncbi:MAG: DNA gyrase inhibitor YacG [Vicinamibacterales bacterium]